MSLEPLEIKEAAIGSGERRTWARFRPLTDTQW